MQWNGAVDQFIDVDEFLGDAVKEATGSDSTKSRLRPPSTLEEHLGVGVENLVEGFTQKVRTLRSVEDMEVRLEAGLLWISSEDSRA